jgi:hypothetical protein
MFRLLAALLLCVGTASAAQEPAPSPTHEAVRDGFGVLLLTTDDDEGFLRAWAGPTPPQLTTTDRATRGRPLFGMILFHGCRAGADGNCNVTGEFSFWRPDGSRYGDVLRADLWRAPPPPAPHENNILLATTSPALLVEPEDPMGNWIMRARVTDSVRGLTLEVEEQIVVETPPTAPVT